MFTGRVAFVKGCALLLLVLAASPLTAPFSAGHPLDLFGGSATHVQGQKAPDDPLVTLWSVPDAPVALRQEPERPLRTSPPSQRSSASFDLPLRL
jgi:hypothetical protein